MASVSLNGDVITGSMDFFQQLIAGVHYVEFDGGAVTSSSSTTIDITQAGTGLHVVLTGQFSNFDGHNVPQSGFISEAVVSKYFVDPQGHTHASTGVFDGVMTVANLRTWMSFNNASGASGLAGATLFDNDTLSGVGTYVDPTIPVGTFASTGVTLEDNGGGKDTLIGTGLNDTLIGGSGDDTYTNVGTNAVIIENQNFGYDTVNTTATFFQLPANVEKLVYTGSGNFTGIGSADDNWIQGSTGNDYLIGGAGNDTLYGAGGFADALQGGTGDDLYLVEKSTDTITEFANEGHDRVETNQTFYVTPANVEDLYYMGVLANFTGIGNELDNTLHGGGGDDTLRGLGGNNTLSGKGGIDTADYSTAGSGIFVNLAAGTAASNGFGGSDTLDTIENVLGSSSADVIIGDGGSNRLDGGPGSDYLIGGAGNDTLVGGSGAANALQGGAGNDTYIVSAVGDSITEFSGEGTDQVQTGLASFNLADNVEQLFYTGTGNFTGIGNAGDNLIVGGVGSDYLIGGAGNDVLIGHAGAANALQGGTGDDVYAVEAVGDTVTEFAGEGNDQVQTNLSSFTLPANVEQLIYTGAGSFTGSGNSGDNVITGGAHDDTLTGAGGADRFVYSAPSGHDTITDFTADNASAGHDLIDLHGRGLTFGDLTIVQNGSDTDITLHGADTIHLVGVAAAQVDAGDFLF